MIKIRRPVLALVALLALSLSLSVQLSPAHAKSAKTKVVAAIFHADWCPGCKAMGPNVMKVMADYGKDKKVKFVKFNLTDEKTKAESEKMAAENGLTKIWKDNQMTGIVLLLDGKTHKVKDTIVSTDSETDMKRKIEAAKLN